MWYDELFMRVEAMNDEAQAAKMAAYMRDKFTFLGIPKTVLKPNIKLFFKQVKNEDIDWDFVKICWQKEYREAQYIAIEYLLYKSKMLKESDLEKIKELIITKSWWESVDMLDGAVGVIVLKHPELRNEMLKWSVSENMWLRRCAIDFQLKYKDKTDAGLLEEIIKNNLGDSEFFINKAIGWSLREYSKTNPKWVREFLSKYEEKLSKLSIKEGSKLLI